MEPVNAKYFDPDTGQPLTGANSLSISEVFPNLAQGLRQLKKKITPLIDEELPFGCDAGTGLFFGLDRGEDD